MLVLLVTCDDRVISRAPGLKLVVQTLLHSLRPIGNIVLICCMFFVVFGILGVQVFSSLLIRHEMWIGHVMRSEVTVFKDVLEGRIKGESRAGDHEGEH